MRRSAFTIIELLIVIAIIGILLALLLPAVQYAREAARRAQCSSNLKQIILGVHHYEAVHKILPPGNSKGFSFLVATLPYLEQDPLFQRLQGQFDPNITPMDGNDVLNKAIVPHFLCPTDSRQALKESDWGPTNYVGNAGTGLLNTGRKNGVFQGLRPNRQGNGPLSLGEITDGTSNTVAISEILPWDMSDRPLRVTYNTRVSYSPNDPNSFELLCSACQSGDFEIDKNGEPESVGSLHGRPWTFGDLGATLYTHSLPPQSRSCFNGSRVQTGVYSAASLHSGAVNAAFADGHVRVISSAIDTVTWRAQGGRNDNLISSQGAH